MRIRQLILPSDVTSCPLTFRMSMFMGDEPQRLTVVLCLAAQTFIGATPVGKRRDASGWQPSGWEYMGATRAVQALAYKAFA